MHLFKNAYHIVKVKPWNYFYVMQWTLGLIGKANSKVYVVTWHNTDTDILCRAWHTKRALWIAKVREFSLVYGKSLSNFYIILSGHERKQLALEGLGSCVACIKCQWMRQLSWYSMNRKVGIAIQSYISENINLNMLHLNEGCPW